MIAAKITMLRMTPYLEKKAADFITLADKVRPTTPGRAGDFAQKDERSVNGTLRPLSAAPSERASGSLLPQVPLGLTRRVGCAVAGSSGQG
ncbi:MAG TPA: hypothetical protein VFK01_01895, partial [Bradyrhizobium sp.]|nr:hypothetical protein [Bradyrhizobium sp.]